MGAAIGERGLHSLYVDREGELLAVSLNCDVYRLVWVRKHLVAHVYEGGGVYSPDLSNSITWSDTSFIRWPLALACLADAGYLLHYGSHIRVGVGKAGGHGKTIKDNRADDDVHKNATGHNSNASPCRLLIHCVWFFLRGHFIQSSHSRDIAETTKRNGFKPVVCVPLRRLPHGWAEAHEESPNAHAGKSCDCVVTELVESDRCCNAYGKQNDSQDVTHATAFLLSWYEGRTLHARE